MTPSIMGCSQTSMVPVSAAGHRPAVTGRPAVLDHREPQIRPPAPPTGRVGDRLPDIGRVGAHKVSSAICTLFMAQLASHIRPNARAVTWATWPPTRLTGQ